MSGGGRDCFALPPGVDWMAVDTALAHLKDNLSPVGQKEKSTLADASGRILAAPLIAKRSNPPMPNSAVDGYGFCGKELIKASERNPMRLKLLKGRAAAGDPFTAKVPEGSAIRILTGAILPEGVDTVVLQENATVKANHLPNHLPNHLIVNSAPKYKENTRASGEDIKKGTVFLEAGHRLRPQDLALSAALGIEQMEVFRRIKIGVISTGNEIIAAGGAAKPYQIFDANRPMLLSMIESWGHQGVDLGQCYDERQAVLNALDDGAEKADIIITTGGASGGDEDYIGRLLSEKATHCLWRIAIKPGRPLAMGHWRGRPIFGLPGNPVAAFVCALIFVKPALDLIAGSGWSRPQSIMLPAAFSKHKKSKRREYLRARLTPQASVEVFTSEGSGRISGLSWATGLVELEDEVCDITHGDLVRFLPFTGFGLF